MLQANRSGRRFIPGGTESASRCIPNYVDLCHRVRSGLGSILPLPCADDSITYNLILFVEPVKTTRSTAQ